MSGQFHDAWKVPEMDGFGVLIKEFGVNVLVIWEEIDKPD